MGCCGQRPLSHATRASCPPLSLSPTATSLPAGESLAPEGEPDPLKGEAEPPQSKNIRKTPKKSKKEKRNHEEVF